MIIDWGVVWVAVVVEAQWVAGVAVAMAGRVRCALAEFE